MDNKNNCDKYEGLFIFHGDEVLNEHLKECSDCKSEHEKYRKLSALIKDAAPAYFAKKKTEKSAMIKKIACCFVVFSLLTTFSAYKIYEDNQYSQLSYSDESYITSMGLPTDEYGFFEI